MKPLMVARVAVWLVAAAALVGAGYAYWEWRLGEFLIATGVFIICQPIAAALRHEQRARAACSPFGPVRRFGYSEAAAHRGVATLAPNARHSADEVRRIVRGRGWRAAWRRMTPWWTWTVLLAVAPTSVALATSPPADADPIADYAFIATLEEFGVLYSSSYQVFAPRNQHVNIHPTALHIWGRSDGRPCMPEFGSWGTI